MDVRASCIVFVYVAHHHPAGRNVIISFPSRTESSGPWVNRSLGSATAVQSLSSETRKEGRDEETWIDVGENEPKKGPNISFSLSQL